MRVLLLVLSVFLAHETKACDSHFVPRTAVALFGRVSAISTNSILGYVQLTQAGPDCETNIVVALTNLVVDLLPCKYHIHISPVSNDNCVSASVHFDPAHLESFSNYTCNPQHPNTTCYVGDLSGKHGQITTATFTASYNDSMVSLFGQDSVIGRSIVVHKNDASRYLCASIEWIRDSNIASFSASFSHNNSNNNNNNISIKGNVNVKQMIGDSSSNTIITVNLSSSSNTSTTLSSWFIATDPTNTCPNLNSNSSNYHDSYWNPFNSTGQYCASSIFVNQTFCAVGDLTGKHQGLTIQSNQQQLLQQDVFVDNNLPLREIEGRALVLVNQQTNETLACANVTNDVNCSAPGIVVRANFPFGSERFDGFFQFSQSALGCPTTVTLYLAGTDIVFSSDLTKFNIHEYSSIFPSNTGPNYDPFHRERETLSYAAECSPASPQLCSIGDLSGKYGFLNTTPTTVDPLFGEPVIERTFLDYNLPLFGMWSVLGRSIVIENTTSGEQFKSAPILLEIEPSLDPSSIDIIEPVYVVVDRETVHFNSTNVLLAGNITFSNISTSGHVIVFGSLYHPIANTSLVLKITKKVANTSTSATKSEMKKNPNDKCSSGVIGSVLNPTEYSGVGCQPTQQAFCAVGDLSGKYGGGLVLEESDTNHWFRFLFSDTNLSMDDLRGTGSDTFVVVSNADGSVIDCMLVLPSPSPSASADPSISPSASPVPSASPHEIVKSNSSGKIMITVAVPCLLIFGSFCLFLWSSRMSRLEPSTGTYQTSMGFVLWVVSLIAFALSLTATRFENTSDFTPFDGTYAHVMVAVNIFDWVWITAAVSFEQFHRRPYSVHAMGWVELSVAVIVLGTSISCFLHFDGDHDYCALDTAQSSACTIYQSSIFFTWGLFCLTCCKIFLTLRRSAMLALVPILRSNLVSATSNDDMDPDNPDFPKRINAKNSSNNTSHSSQPLRSNSISVGNFSPLHGKATTDRGILSMLQQQHQQQQQSGSVSSLALSVIATPPSRTTDAPPPVEYSSS